MSCLASQSNIVLPAYSEPGQIVNVQPVRDPLCNCQGARDQQIAASSTPVTTSTSDLGDPATAARGLAPPPEAHVASHADDALSDHNLPPRPFARPIHLLRAPSFAPPAFESLPPPPPPLDPLAAITTPPPDYTSVVHSADPMTDYFSRLHLAESFAEDSDPDLDDDSHRGRPARVDVPLTPGGRVNRSMDVPRGWVGVGLS